jgi:6-phosphogluconolactonase
MRSIPNRRPPSLLLAVTASLALAACADQSTQPDVPLPADARSSGPGASEAGAVYTTTNGASANAVIAFRRAADGALTSLGAFPTGGQGIGGGVDPLTSQYAVILNDDDRLLFTVNAGSDDVTSFRVADDGSLALTDRRSSGGDRPVSLAAHGHFLYVLNAGDNAVTGLRVNPQGKLLAIPGATRALAAGASGASTIHFSADGAELIVTERLSNRIETLAVGADGRLGAPVVTASSGATPFGFDVTTAGVAVVSEAGGTAATAPNGSVSSYRTGAGGSLELVTGSISTGGMAPCWVIATTDGRFAFVANSASNAIASVGVGGNGSLTLLDAAAATTAAGATPIDIDLSTGDRFLYALEAGAGTVGVFVVGSGGSLTVGTAVPTGQSGSSGLQGIAAF